MEFGEAVGYAHQQIGILRQTSEAEKSTPG